MKMNGKGERKSERISIPDVKRKLYFVKGYYTGSGSSSDEGGDDERPRLHFITDYSEECLKVIKCLKFIQIALNKDHCVLGLSFMACCDLKAECCINSILNRGGLETLVNLAETNDYRCRAGALRVLKKLTQNPRAMLEVIHLGLPSVLVERLGEHLMDIRILACSIISNIGHNRVAARAIRKNGGIGRLVSQLSVSKPAWGRSLSSLPESERLELLLTSEATHALWKLAKFKKNRTMMLNTGIILHMTEVILSGWPELSVPMTGVISLCSTDRLVQYAIEDAGIIGMLTADMMKHRDVEKKLLCCVALANAAGGSETVRQLLREQQGLEVVVQLLRGASASDVDYIVGLLTFIWKTAISPANVQAYEALCAHKEVACWLDFDDVRVKTAAVGAVGELAKRKSCRKEMVSLDVVTPITSALVTSHEPLLINGALALGMLIKDSGALQQLKDMNGVRLLWSLLKSPLALVRNQALWALKMCIQNDRDNAERTRSISGAIDLLLNMLRSSDVRTLAGACAVLAQVAIDEENLAVMSEKGVVKVLAQVLRRETQRHQRKDSAGGDGGLGLGHRVAARPSTASMGTRSRLSWAKELPIDDFRSIHREELRREVSSAIAACCAHKDNDMEFGRLGVISQIVSYLSSPFSDTRAHAGLALWRLSENKVNCVYLHGCQALPALLKSIGSKNQLEQISVAGCIKNIRINLLRADTSKMCGGDQNKRIRSLVPSMHRISIRS